LYFSTITLKMDGEGRSFLTELGGLGVVDFGLRRTEDVNDLERRNKRFPLIMVKLQGG
jgi:hypothetical protein